MMIIRSGLVLLTAVTMVGAVASAGCDSSTDKAGGVRTSEPVVLSMVNPLDGWQVQPFLNEVARRSQGSIRIELESAWHQGDIKSEADLIRHVQAGKASLGLAPARAWNGVGVRSFDALIAPLTVDSFALEQRVLDSDLAPTMLAGISAAGVEGLGIMPGEMRRPVGASRELLGLQDYHGASIGISPSAVAARTLQAWGANAVPFSFQGAPIDAFDGVDLQVSGIGSSYDGIATSVTANVNLWPRPLVLFANARAFAALPEAQRRVLTDAARSTVAAGLSSNRADEKVAVGNICRRGSIRFITASAGQIDGLRRALGPVYAWLREDPQTRSYLDRIRALRAGLESAAAQEAPSCPITSPGVAAGRQRTALDGVYRVSTTLTELAVIDRGDDIPANYGDWTWVFDRGRFASTQVNSAKAVCTWGYGTFSVQGGELTLTFTDGGGNVSSGPNEPGESFSYGWSLYRDVVTLAAASGSRSPEPFRVKPWRRVSPTPSARYLSTQCPPPAVALPR